MRRNICSALLLAGLMLFAGCSAPPSGTPEPSAPESSESQPESSAPAEDAPEAEGPVVETRSGKVAGVYEDGIAAFKGIPYAAPPVGELRFAPPQPMEAWDDLRDCTQFKDSPLQAKADEGLTYSEDCLYLNIWTPEDAAGKSLPVLVFIHGGAYAQGSPNKPLYSGTRFAQDGIIQVNIGYRVNVMGFFASEEIEEQYGTLGNCGTLDQIQALQWIQDNIASFGGDPANVTISGESAGAFSVSNMIVSPKAKGLFARGIMESGNLLGSPLVADNTLGDRETALATADRFMEQFDCKTVADLQKVDGQALVDAAAFSFDMTKPSDYVFWPVFDGKVIPENPYQTVKEGAINQVDILAGFNTNEGSIFIDQDITEEDYKSYLDIHLGDKAAAVLERYPVDADHTPADRARFVVGMGMRMGTDYFANEMSRQGSDVYFYNFDYAIPSLVEKGYGTPHAVELLFVFDSFPDSVQMTDADIAFKEEVHNRWLNFIRTGDPNQGEPMETQWPKYSAESGELLVLNAQSHPQPAFNTEDVAFFNALFWE